MRSRRSSHLAACAPAAAIAIALAGPALAAGMSHVDILAQYGVNAPPKVVHDLQVRAQDQVPMFLEALPEKLRGRPFEIDVENASGGVTIHVALEGSASEADAAAHALALPLKGLVDEVGGDYASHIAVQAEGFRIPGLSLPGLPGLPSLPALPGGNTAKAILGVIVAAAGAILVGSLIKRGLGGTRRLPQPILWGAPVLGLLPESLARVGKLYHLQSKPCQAMGYFFLQQAQGVRRVAVCAATPESGGTVSVTLGLFLVREGQKVLLVDLSGESNVVPSILSRFGTPPEDAAEGSLVTSIPDLDLMTMSRGDGSLPELPPEIANGYDRILFVMPPGTRPRGIPCIDVVLKASLRSAMTAWFGAPRVGWVFFGDGVPVRVSDSYYTRYYYEKLQEASAT